jgi:hypothetical protein
MDHYINIIISLVPLCISICTDYQVFSFINHASPSNAFHVCKLHYGPGVILGGAFRKLNGSTDHK